MFHFFLMVVARQYSLVFYVLYFPSVYQAYIQFPYSSYNPDLYYGDIVKFTLFLLIGLGFVVYFLGIGTKAIINYKNYSCFIWAGSGSSSTGAWGATYYEQRNFSGLPVIAYGIFMIISGFPLVLFSILWLWINFGVYLVDQEIYDFCLGLGKNTTIDEVINLANQNSFSVTQNEGFLLIENPSTWGLPLPRIFEYYNACDVSIQENRIIDFKPTILQYDIIFKFRGFSQ